jgi:hypothetical protein
MKKSFYILGICSLCLFASCSTTEEAKPKTLTASALVNGNNFAITQIFATKNDLTNKNLWNISLLSMIEKQEREGKIVYTQQISVIGNITKIGTYDLTKKFSNISQLVEGECTANFFMAATNETKNIPLGYQVLRIKTGTLTITKITEKTATGTFSFDGNMLDVETRVEQPIAVTDAKFDVTFN